MEVFFRRDLVAPNKTESLLGVLCWGMYLVGFSLLLDLFGNAWEGSRGAVLRSLSGSVGNFILLLCVFRGFLWRSRCPFGAVSYVAVLGFIATYGISSMMDYLLSFFPFEPFNPNQSTLVWLYETDKLSMTVDIVLLSPIIEELLLRGLIFAPLCKKSPLLAYCASIAAFAGLHVIGFIGMEGFGFSAILYSFLSYVPGSLMLGWAYQQCGSIYGPIALHILWNAGALFLF